MAIEKYFYDDSRDRFRRWKKDDFLDYPEDDTHQVEIIKKSQDITNATYYLCIFPNEYESIVFSRSEGNWCSFNAIDRFVLNMSNLPYRSSIISEILLAFYDLELLEKKLNTEEIENEKAVAIVDEIHLLSNFVDSQCKCVISAFAYLITQENFFKEIFPDLKIVGPVKRFKTGSNHISTCKYYDTED